MATSPQQEFIWQGQIHIGDEPGIYGDAHYAGLRAELPVTIYRLSRDDHDELTFDIILETKNLETFQGYIGHTVTVVLYEADPVNPNHYMERVLATALFTSQDKNYKAVPVSIGKALGPCYISVRFRVDTTVAPGLYNDFIWARLALSVANFRCFASFGFDSLF